MNDEQESLALDTRQRIHDVLARHGAVALADYPNAEAAAQAWLEAGFDDAEEVDEWLSARCFSARSAQTLEARGLTPTQAAIRTTSGASGREDTIGYKLTVGDLSFDEAQRIITSNFWDS